MLNISTVFDGAYDHKVCPEQGFLSEHFCSVFGTLALASHSLLEPLAAGTFSGASTGTSAAAWLLKNVKF